MCLITFPSESQRKLHEQGGEHRKKVTHILCQFAPDCKVCKILEDNCHMCDLVSYPSTDTLNHLLEMINKLSIGDDVESREVRRQVVKALLSVKALDESKIADEHCFEDHGVAPKEPSILDKLSENDVKQLTYFKRRLSNKRWDKLVTILSHKELRSKILDAIKSENSDAPQVVRSDSKICAYFDLVDIQVKDAKRRLVEYSIELVGTLDYKCLLTCQGFKSLFHPASTYKCFWCCSTSEDYCSFNRQQWRRFGFRAAPPADSPLAPGQEKNPLLSIPCKRLLPCALHATMNLTKLMLKSTLPLLYEEKIRQQTEMNKLTTQGNRAAKRIKTLKKRMNEENRRRPAVRKPKGDVYATEITQVSVAIDKLDDEIEMKAAALKAANRELGEDLDNRLMELLEKEFKIQRYGSETDFKFDKFIDNVSLTYPQCIDIINKHYKILSFLDSNLKGPRDEVQSIIDDLREVWKQYTVLTYIMKSDNFHKQRPTRFAEQGWISRSLVFGANIQRIFNNRSTSYLHMFVFHMGWFIEQYGCMDKYANYGLEGRHQIHKEYVYFSNKKFNHTFMVLGLIHSFEGRPLDVVKTKKNDETASVSMDCDSIPLLIKSSIDLTFSWRSFAFKLVYWNIAFFTSISTVESIT
eukprot:gene21511-25835_t